MNHAAYEVLVQDLARALSASAVNCHPCSVTGGVDNLVRGASGFDHQIDVVVRRSTDILLVECKYWTRSIGVQPVLVLASRVADIGANVSDTLRVHGSIVSKKRPTAGAITLAAYFGLSIDYVMSPEEYGLEVFEHQFTGVSEKLTVTGCIENDEILRNGVIIRPGITSIE